MTYSHKILSFPPYVNILLGSLEQSVLCFTSSLRDPRKTKKPYICGSWNILFYLLQKYKRETGESHVYFQSYTESDNYHFSLFYSHGPIPQ